MLYKKISILSNLNYFSKYLKKFFALLGSLPYTILQLSVSFFGIIGNVIVIFVILILREYQKSVTHW